jgi:hypothetical protein
VEELLLLSIRPKLAHRFTAGGFQKSNAIPADRSTYGNFDITQDNNRKVIQSVLESEDEDVVTNFSSEEHEAEVNNLRKLRRGWKACLNEVSDYVYNDRRGNWRLNCIHRSRTSGPPQ